MVTVYHAKNTRSIRVLWTLEELGVKADVRSLPFPPSKLQPDYLSVNPTGTVPTLIDGPVRLTESMAICEYLAEKFPDANLWPKDPSARAIARSVSNEGFPGARAAESCWIRVRTLGSTTTG